MAAGDSTQTPLERALAQIDLARVRTQIVRYATARTRSREHGEELAQMALTGAIDPQGSPWDPERDPDFARYLIGRVNGALASERKKLRLRADPGIVAMLWQRIYRPAQTPGDVAIERERREGLDRRWRALRESFDGASDSLALRVLDQYEEGTIDAAAQAQALGADVCEVYAQHKRIARRARALRGDGSDPKMVERRASSRSIAQRGDDEVGP
ncbi:MAG: hypothetical protein ACREJ3_11825 [Polyangiaceae bacterium]